MTPRADFATLIGLACLGFGESLGQTRFTRPTPPPDGRYRQPARGGHGTKNNRAFQNRVRARRAKKGSR